MTAEDKEAARYAPDSGYAWWRMTVALALSTLGGIGLWSVVVLLPVVEAEFGVDRGGASLPYAATLLGFGLGGVFMGRLADRFGVMWPAILGTIMLACGYMAASQVTALWQFIAIQAVLIGMLGASATFGPLVADISHWFVRRRGTAVAVVASGNYLSGTLWPPLLQYAVETVGWRQAHFGIGVICLAVMLPLALLLRRRPTLEDEVAVEAVNGRMRATGLSRRQLQGLLVVAGVACCVAMSMPQVHIIAYCGDLGYGAQRGAEMLSLMLGFGVISRMASGFIADYIGGVRILILSSLMQCLALFLYLPFDGLMPLYIVSALFGLAQGGIVPSYALIVREYFPAREAGARVSLVLFATVIGMAFGGWMSGEIYDYTGSYQAAFFNGIAWNLLNMSIAFWLLIGSRRSRQTA
jgi:MFS family permease